MDYVVVQQDAGVAVEFRPSQSKRSALGVLNLALAMVAISATLWCAIRGLSDVGFLAVLAVIFPGTIAIVLPFKWLPYRLLRVTPSEVSCQWRLGPMARTVLGPDPRHGTYFAVLTAPGRKAKLLLIRDEQSVTDIAVGLTESAARQLAVPLNRVGGGASGLSSDIEQAFRAAGHEVTIY